MKKLILVLTAFSALASCEKSEDSASCKDPGLIHRNAVCTDHYDPVCGCDGETYANACVAKFQYGITEYSNGACACNYPYQGVVVDYTGLDGCGLLIELDNSEILEPRDLPSGFILKAGSRVELDYVPATSASICMAGEVVSISCIRKASCLPLSEPSVGNTHAHKFRDSVSFNSVQVQGDCLEINFSHGGGCEEHEYKMTTASDSANARVLEFLHEANGDLCQALLTKTRYYDLMSLRDNSSDSVEFYLRHTAGGYSEKFVYEY